LALVGWIEIWFFVLAPDISYQLVVLKLVFICSRQSVWSAVLDFCKSIIKIYWGISILKCDNHLQFTPFLSFYNDVVFMSCHKRTFS